MTRKELQDPMKRPTGWYHIMRRMVGGKFSKKEDAFWERNYDYSYGEWTYRNCEIRVIAEMIQDDLVLGEIECY